ncbi:putative Ig domain-containing protein [Methanolobus profundi]|uniref:PGF-pre-PGF domain-containing protein n=1 Tax=Methanolobus profundi TaxID=487685 RepID=A0A1I4U8T1_9EURY|nr:putative Ig domain-containing protein [Methanolobus profundi]SFM85372.1 PGF-pre-PGF domain-containing protein [Methanolobus profundi]
MFPGGSDKHSNLYFILKSIVLLIILVPVVSSAYSNETVIMGSTVTNNNTSFFLPLFVENATGMRSLSLDINFNNASLQIDDIEVNDTLSGFQLAYYLNNSTGFANMSLSSVNIITDEKTHVADLFFRAMAMGTYDVLLNNVSVENDTLSYPAQFVTNGSVRVNYPPIIGEIADMMVSTGSIISFQLTASDEDDAVLTYGAEDLPLGSELNSSTGAFSWIPSTDDIGEHAVDFSVSDGYAVDNTQANITVISTVTDTAPEMEPIGNQSVNENQTLYFTINAIDQEGDPVEYSSSDLPDDSTLDNVTGEFRWVTDHEDAGTYSVEFIASANGLSDSEIIIIEVFNINRPPVLDPIGNREVDEGSTLSFFVSGSDPDKEPVNYSVIGLPDNATFDNFTGEFIWTTSDGDQGLYSLTFYVSDGLLSDSGTMAVTVKDVNHAPILSIPSSASVAEGATLLLDLNASDPDGDALVYSKDVTFGSLDNGIFSWTSGYSDEGTYQVTFTVNDSELNTSGTVAIYVSHTNSAPVLEVIPDVTVSELGTVTIELNATDIDDDELTFGKNVTFGDITDNVFTWGTGLHDSGIYTVLFNVSDGEFTDSKTMTITVENTNSHPVITSVGTQYGRENELISFTLNASDADNDTLTYTSSPLPDGANLGSTTGIFTWVPDYGQSGTYDIEFSVSDGQASISDTMAITVQDVNRPPVLSLPSSANVAEGDALLLDLNASDPDGNELVYSKDVSFGSLDDGIFSWTPGFSDEGTHQVTFTVNDSELNTSGTVVIYVSNTNSAPVLEEIPDVTISELGTVVIELNATDIDDESLTYTASPLPDGSDLGYTTGVFTWTPGYDQSGIYEIEFTVSDGQASTSDNITITVQDVNAPPILSSIGSRSVNENDTLSITLSATDADNDTLSYFTNASFGSLVDDVFTWTTTYEDSGIYYAEFTVNDGIESDSETVQITVNDVNRPPFIEPISDKVVDEDEELVVLITASDPDGDELFYSKDVAFGNLDNKIFTWTPGFDDNGLYGVNITVSDGYLEYTEFFKIAVGNTNVPPVLGSIGNKEVDEGQLLFFTINATDADPNDVLTYSVSGNPSGSSFDPTTHEFTWTPSYSQAGSYSVVFEVSDGAYIDVELITIVVNDVNLPPVLNSIGNRTVDENSEISFVISGSDPDPDTLSYTVTGAPSGSSFSGITGEFSWTPGYEDSGPHDVTFSVSDGSLSDSETVTITVNDVNRPPELEPIGNKAVAEGSELVFTVSGSDPDDDTVTLEATGVPSGASFDENTGEFSWTPGFDDSGTYSITFTISDGSLSDSETISISVGSVNRAPELNPIGNKSVDENSELRFTVSGTDPDGGTLVYSVEDAPLDVSFDENSGEFIWIPGYEDSGTYDLTFIVSDGFLSDSETVTITVNNVNRAPVLAAIGNKAVAEGSELSFTVSASDPDGDDPVLSAVGVPDDASFDENTGQFTWTTDFDDSGSYSVTFSVSDGSLSDSETISISVGSVNRAPVMGTIGNREVDENSEIVISLSATDPDEDQLVYSISNSPEDASFSSSTGQFRWTPDHESSGIYPVTFTVSDGSLSDSETIFITVNDVNRPPVLDVIGNKVVSEGTELSFTISGSDADLNNLIYTASSVPDGAHFDAYTRKFTWTPDFDDSGTYSVTFTVSDGSLSDSETISISVGSVNRAPELDLIGDRTVYESSELRFTVSGTDPDTGDQLSYSTSVLPDDSTFNANTGEFVWITDFDDSGTYTLTFTVSDGSLSDSETIVITVVHVNREPVLMVTGSRSVDENKALTITLDAVDYDEDTLLYSVTDQPSGSLLDPSNGVFTWTPTYEQAGVYTVTFVVSDGLEEDTEDVEITVNDINRPPVIDLPDNVQVAENSTLVLDLNASDPDEGDILLYSRDVEFGSLNNGVFTWTPGYSDEGTYHVKFTVNDTEFTVSDTVIIDVTNSNSAPVIESISDTLVNELDTVTIELIASDIDDDDELTFTKDVTYGDLADNIFTWTPDVNDSGFHSIVFTVSDGQLTDSTVAKIAVGNTNMPPVIVPPDEQHGKENELLTFTLNASDEDDGDNEILTYAVLHAPSGAAINSSTGVFTWTPTYEQSGNYYVEFTVSDKLYTAVQYVTIDIDDVNRAPVFGQMLVHYVNETETLQISLNASDPDNDELSYSTNSGVGQVIGDIFTWTPGYSDGGDHSINLTVTDGHLTDNTTISVHVNEKNMAPEIDTIGSFSVYENQTLEFSINATDADDDELTYSAGGLPSGASLNASTGLFTWRPGYTQSGLYSVEFRVTDGELNASEAVSIRVYDVDRSTTEDYSGFTTGSSGGSGGGSSSASEDYANVAYKDYSIQYVTQGKEVTFEFPNRENYLEYVKFDALQAAGQITAVIEILKDRSSLVSSSPSGDVYHYINIWVGDVKFNSGNYFSSAQISFKVEKEWLTENNVDPSAIKMYRYSSGAWKELKTSRIGTDSSYYYYKAETPGFSPFAIVSTGSSPVLRNTVPDVEAESTRISYGDESRLNSIDAVSDAEAMNEAVSSSSKPIDLGFFFIGIIGILGIGSVLGYRSRDESVVLSRYYEALHGFLLAVRNAVEWLEYKLSSESREKDYAILSEKWQEMRNADYRAIYERQIAEIKERQKR